MDAVPSFPLPQLRWASRSPAERVWLYTAVSLYLVYLFFMVLLGLVVVGTLRSDADLAIAIGLALALSAGGLWSLDDLMRTSGRAWPRLPALILLAVATLAAGAFVATLPRDPAFNMVMLVVCAWSWWVGAVADRRAWWALASASAALGWWASQQADRTAYAVGVSMFLMFTVSSSVWLMNLVRELEDARATAAGLAVAEERLRFSRDVHDVMGRRLSEIAVQAELATAYVTRGDQRAASSIADVRATAHAALREARELARGYRPVDLAQELQGARALLQSAGITTDVDVVGMPKQWAEPAARVVRECVTNVLRHSRAGWVRIAYADGVLTIENDGAGTAARKPSGSGLRALRDLAIEHGGTLESTHDGDTFTVKLLVEEAR